MSVEWDYFFYYGSNDLGEEIRQDLLNGISTGKNKLFFNRSDSAGINDFSNAPTGLAMQIGIIYNIAKWIAYRNTYTGNGVNSKDRRVATSQDAIEIKQNNRTGDTDINVFYIPFYNYNENKSISIPLGV